MAVRKQRPARGRLKVAAFATAGSMILVWFGSLMHDRGGGRALELYLCLAGICFVVTARRLIAGVLAEERRNQTLGLLFSSGLSVLDVFVGKFLTPTRTTPVSKNGMSWSASRGAGKPCKASFSSGWAEKIGVGRTMEKPQGSCRFAVARISKSAAGRKLNEPQILF